MNLLGAILYDPAVAVNKVTTAALAMTALDTTNLRLAITVPAHGKVRFRMGAVLHGATTFPSILLGVMVGAAVKGRIAPVQSLGNTAVATALVSVEADFIVTGLAAGATNFDAAYGVETLVAATGLKYGGPDNTTANDAFGGFFFEAWDPQPMTANSTLAVDANGRVDVIKVAGTTQTARDLGLALPAAAPGAAGGLLIDDVWTDARAAKLDNLDAAVTTRAAIVDYTAARATKLDNLDATISSRLATSGYTVPPTVAAIRAEIDANSVGLAAIFARTDVATSTRLASASYVAPDNAGVAAIKAKTDSLVFTIAGKVDASLYYVNGLAITGLGTEASPWKAP